MNRETAEIYQQLSDIAETAQTAPNGDAEALHNILIDLINATRELAVATGAVEAEAPEAPEAPAAEPLDFWARIEAMVVFAKQKAAEDGSGIVDLWEEFSHEIDMHIFNEQENAECQCYAYPIRNGETDTSMEIKIF
jgi:hypothetical protein